jgi:hypothetical protein
MKMEENATEEGNMQAVEVHEIPVRVTGGVAAVVAEEVGLVAGEVVGTNHLAVEVAALEVGETATAEDEVAVTELSVANGPVDRIALNRLSQIE